MAFPSLKRGVLALMILAQAVPSVAAGTDVVVEAQLPPGSPPRSPRARLGNQVVLVAPEDHIGGIIANGLTNSDILNTQSVGGLFFDFTRRVLRYYQTHEATFGDRAANVKLCNNGYWFEPSVAEQIFHEMVDEQPRPDSRCSRAPAVLGEARWPATRRDCRGA